MRIYLALAHWKSIALTLLIICEILEMIVLGHSYLETLGNTSSLLIQLGHVLLDICKYIIMSMIVLWNAIPAVFCLTPNLSQVVDVLMMIMLSQNPGDNFVGGLFYPLLESFFEKPRLFLIFCPQEGVGRT